MIRDLRISKSEELPEALDFGWLFNRGLARAQDLTGDIWTDYNEHDPGVTMLQALCYGLTDLAYRTAHPMQDLLSSSSASTGVSIDKQPLFTGDRILVTAPVTADDVRKLVFGRIRGVRNVWIAPDPSRKNTFDVQVDLYSEGPDASATAMDDQRGQDGILDRIRALLNENRPLGVRFGKIEPLTSHLAGLEASVELAETVNPAKAAAKVMFALENLAAPVPDVQNIETLMKAGVSPDQIYDGPPVDVGRITFGPSSGSFVASPIETAQTTLQNVPGVSNALVEPAMPSTDLEGLRGARSSALRVFSGSAMVLLDQTRALEDLQSLEDAQRWAALYGVNTLEVEKYGQVLQGDAHRNLSRYRSIQYLFPQIYGLGPYGTDDTSEARAAEVRQLKGYLLFFEQLLANYLSQLNNVARIFSFSEFWQSYFPQPVAHSPARADDPPFIDPVLGSLKDDEWHRVYVGKLARIVAGQDPFRDRLNRALGHMLARFGETFDDARIQRLSGKTPEKAAVDRIGQKREFLQNCVELGRDRGLGINLAAPALTALQERVALKTGLSVPSLLIEHAVLGDPILVTGPFRALNVQIRGFQATGILDQPVAIGGWPLIQSDILAAFADAECYTIMPMSDYSVAMRVGSPDRPGMWFADRFVSFAQARRVRDRLCKDAPELSPTVFPTDFSGNRISVILGLSLDADAQAAREFVTNTFRFNLPAYLQAGLYWVSSGEFDRLSSVFRQAVADGQGLAQIELVQAIDRLACADFDATLASELTESPL